MWYWEPINKEEFEKYKIIRTDIVEWIKFAQKNANKAWGFVPFTKEDLLKTFESCKDVEPWRI